MFRTITQKTLKFALLEPLWSDSTGDPWISPTKGHECGKRFPSKSLSSWLPWALSTVHIFDRDITKLKTLDYWPSFRGIHQWLVSPKGPVTRFHAMTNLHTFSSVVVGHCTCCQQPSRPCHLRRPFLRRAMNCGTRRITGQLRQPTTSLHTWPVTWDIKGCLCLFKHHSLKHTPDW